MIVVWPSIPPAHAVWPVSINRGIKLAAGIAGIATMVLGLIMLSIFPKTADLREGFHTPIIAFEFAKTETDLSFMAGSSPEAITHRQKMEAGMQWDMLFPLAYGGLLFLLLLDLAFKGHTIAWLGVSVAVFIFPFDIFENLTLLEITGALNASAATEAILNNLQLATWLKWGTIAITMAVLSATLFADKQKTFAILAAITSVSMALCWLSGSNPLIAEIMAGLSSVFFLVFSMKAVVMAWHALKSTPINGTPK